MNMKRVSLGGLVVTLLCLGGVRADDTSAPPISASGPSMSTPGGEPAPSVDGTIPGAGLRTASWMAYPRCAGCCGPVGANGPLGYEVYVRNGFNFPLGGNPFGANLKTGWDVDVGARTLFFNPEVDAAWTVDLSVSNVHNGSSNFTTQYNLTNLKGGPNGGGAVVPSVNVAVRDLNRTYVNAAVGREWYLWGNADRCKPDVNWRVGFDVGGRYGTEKLEVTNFNHLTDVIAGTFGSVHTDLEIPWRCCIFQAGIRAEYGYTWGDVLQRQNDGDVQEINLLFTLGTRF
jgi:hypothetical protein